MDKFTLYNNGSAVFRVTEAGQCQAADGFLGSFTGDVSGTAGGLSTDARFRSSSDLTGTGSAQNIAHGLGDIPVVFGFEIRAGHDGSGGAGTQCPAIVEGTHTTTNLVVTVTAGAKFRAWAIKG